MKIETNSNVNLKQPNSPPQSIEPKLEAQGKATPPTQIQQNLNNGKQNTPKVAIDNTAQNLQKLQAIAIKFGLDKATGPDKKPFTLEQRANRRDRLKLVQKQQNLERILEDAAEYIDSSNANEEVDPDWLYQFFEAAESIYSRPMQQLWGKILAMQTAKPNRFSLRALDTLKKMTYQEACTFQLACALLLKDKSGTGGKIMTGLYRQQGILNWFKPAKAKHINLSKFGLSYPDLLSLIDLGLIYSSEIESSPFPLGHALALETMQSKVILTIKQPNIILTYYKLTQAGRELASLIATSAKEEYFNQLSEIFAPECEVIKS
ncbi:TIGR03899 family protein [Catenovulum sp. 2E275]|uniref:TIGR03899 family protein n=1 Tax=Catenovulum sp. 2E275 TaxID=2980497 RepID=UPI0021D155B1|nr:TIGR03899 family protein [Catenovulum sp. 2E275]MCU4676068.1 TIGR03899 family protein [Catenovulum sp. 2E275]